MRNLLALFGFTVLVVAGLGFYRGWFNIDIQKDGGDGNIRFQGHVDPKKSLNDISEGIKAVGDGIGELSNRINTKDGESTGGFFGSLFDKPAAPKPNSPLEQKK